MSSSSSGLTELIKGSGVVFVGVVLGRAFGFLGQILIIRELPPETFGHIALAFTIMLAISRIALMGVPTGAARLISASQTSNRQQKFIQSGLIIALIGGMVALILVYMLRFQLSALMEDSELPRFLMLFAPYLLLYPIAQVLIAVLRSQKLPLQAVLSRDLAPYLGATLIFLGFSFINEIVFGAVLYWLSIPLFMGIFALRYVSQEYSLSSVVGELPDMESFNELWSFSWPLAFRTSFALLLTNLDILMIGYFLGTVDVAQYRAIQPLRQLTIFVLLSVVFMYLPLATEYYGQNDLASLRDLYTTSTKWIAAVTFPVVLVLVFFPTDIIRVLFKPAYTPAAPALSVLIAGLFFRSVAGPTAPTINAIDRPRVELAGSFVGVVVNVALNVFLIPRYGIVGAAIATSIGYIVYNLIEIGVLYHTIGVHPFSANNLKPMVPTVVAAIGLHQFLAANKLSFIVLLLVGVVLSVVHLFSIIFTKSLDEMDLMLLDQLDSRINIDLTWVKSLINIY